MDPQDVECVYEYLRQCARQRQLPPTYREIARHCLLSTGSVTRQLDRLELQGRIRREHGKARGIILLDPTEEH